MRGPLHSVASRYDRLHASCQAAKLPSSQPSWQGGKVRRRSMLLITETHHTPHLQRWALDALSLLPCCCCLVIALMLLCYCHYCCALRNVLLSSRWFWCFFRDDPFAHLCTALGHNKYIYLVCELSFELSFELPFELSLELSFELSFQLISPPKEGSSMQLAPTII